MSFLPMMNQIIALFLVLFLGFYLRKKGVIKEEENEFIFYLVLDYILPCLIISGMLVEVGQDVLRDVLYLIIGWFIAYLLVIIVGAGISKLISSSPKEKRTFQFIFIVSNIVFLGFPILAVLFPERGILYGAIGVIPFYVVVWTYGIYLLQKKKELSLKKMANVFNNNGNIALAFGFIILVTGIQLPEALVEAIELIGGAAFPLAMFAIGASLYGMSFRKIVVKPKLLVFSFVKLLLLPLLIMIILLQLPIGVELIAVIAIQYAMPVAGTSVVFTARFSGDHYLASEGVFITTLLSFITIPAIVALIFMFL